MVCEIQKFPFKKMHVARSAPTHYLGQCWLIVSWTLGKNSSEIKIRIKNFSFTIMNLNISSAKRQSAALWALCEGNRWWLVDKKCGRPFLFHQYDGSHHEYTRILNWIPVAIWHWFDIIWLAIRSLYRMLFRCGVQLFVMSKGHVRATQTSAVVRYIIRFGWVLKALTLWSCLLLGFFWLDR